MKSSRIAIIITVTLALALLLAGVYVNYLQRELSLLLQLKIVDQEKTLVSLSEITNRNGADAVAETIIKDCDPANRARFEELLNTLSTLNGGELSELDSLFSACASFFAERKAVMVSRLEREFEVYEGYIELYATVDDADAIISYPTEDWRQIVALENERKELLQEQLVIQAQVITSIKNGDRQSDSFQSLLVRASQINEESAAVNSEIAVVRQRLNDI